MSPLFRQELLSTLPRLRRFALGLTADPAEADDLVQSASERALLRHAQWQEGSRMDRWMFRIMQNLWIDRLRARPPLADLDDEALAALPDASWSEGLEDRLHLHQVLAAIQQLPAPMRAVMMLVCVEDLSYREAAEVLELPIGTVMSRLSRARTALHRLLGEDHARVQ